MLQCLKIFTFIELCFLRVTVLSFAKIKECVCVCVYGGFFPSVLIEASQIKACQNVCTSLSLNFPTEFKIVFCRR